MLDAAGSYSQVGSEVSDRTTLFHKRGAGLNDGNAELLPVHETPTDSDLVDAKWAPDADSALNLGKTHVPPDNGRDLNIHNPNNDVVIDESIGSISKLGDGTLINPLNPPIDIEMKGQDSRIKQYLEELYELSGIETVSSLIIPDPNHEKKYILNKHWSEENSEIIRAMGISRVDPETLELLLEDHYYILNGDIDRREEPSIQQRSQLKQHLETIFSKDLTRIESSCKEYFSAIEELHPYGGYAGLEPKEIILDHLLNHFHSILQYVRSENFPEDFIEILKRDWYIKHDQAALEALKNSLGAATASIASAAQSGVQLAKDSQEFHKLTEVQEEILKVEQRIKDLTNGSLAPDEINSNDKATTKTGLLSGIKKWAMKHPKTTVASLSSLTFGVGGVAIANSRGHATTIPNPTAIVRINTESQKREEGKVLATPAVKANPKPEKTPAEKVVTTETPTVKDKPKTTPVSTASVETVTEPNKTVSKPPETTNAVQAPKLSYSERCSASVNGIMATNKTREQKNIEIFTTLLGEAIKEYTSIPDPKIEITTSHPNPSDFTIHAAYNPVTQTFLLREILLNNSIAANGRIGSQLVTQIMSGTGVDPEQSSNLHEAIKSIETHLLKPNQ